MKRVAENQLTKDDHDDDDDDVQEVDQLSEGFKKADESVLAKRPIRALPKRTLGGPAAKAASFNGFATSPTPSSSADKETPPPPKFAGFAGFGAGSSAASNPFTFSVQPPSIAAPPTSVFGFAASDTGFRPQSNSKPVQPAFGPDTSNGTSSFASDATKPAGHERTDAASLKYYKSLRGLNVSFLSVISKEIEQDPFIDVAGLLESYKNLRMSVQSEFDNALKLGGTPSHTPEPSSIFASTPAPQFAMPKPPTTFSTLLAPPPAPIKPPSTSDSAFTFGATSVKTSGFSLPSSGSSSSTLAPFGFTPKTNEPSSSSSASVSEPPKSYFSFGSSKFDDTSPPKVSSLAFTPTPSAKPSSESSANALETTLAPAGPSSLPASGSSVFGSTSAAPNFFTSSKTSSTSTDTSVKTATVFGSSSVFGSSGDTGKFSLFSTSTTSSTSATSHVLDGGDETAKGPGTSLFDGNKFGNISGNAFSSEKSMGLFGAGYPQKPSTFSFGKPAGSIGNPVGFIFGAPTSKVGDSGSAGSSKPPTGLGVTAKLPEDTLSPPSTEKSSESTPQPESIEENIAAEDDTPKLLSTSSHDEEGEGEEDEETMYAVRCKLFKLTKTDDNQEWKDLGIGMFRLKKHKETNVRRVLMRNGNTGKILINFRLYAGLRLSLAKTSLSFVGHDNGAPASYRIRVKTDEQASELKMAIEGEIAALQASSS
ncbi:hypothetical protein V8B97DRAFT_2003615 [Scleroderma yunnanense]